MILEKIQVGAGRHDPAHRAIRRNNCETFLDTAEIARISDSNPSLSLLPLEYRYRTFSAFTGVCESCPQVSFADPSGSPALGLHKVAAVPGWSLTLSLRRIILEKFSNRFVEVFLLLVRFRFRI